MKRFITSFAGFLSFLTLAIAPMASASTFWQVEISSPATQTSRTFNVQYTVLATSVADFSVQLFQDDSPSGSPQTTTTDASSAVGNSGTFSVTVPSDGTYAYKVTATCQTGDCAEASKTSNTVNVTVDATSPAAPIYHGKTQSGNTYTINFTAPNTADVTHVKIYASTSKSYTADGAHQVGDVAVTANQVVAYNYGAPDATTRYFSVQAFDAAGNGSPIVGDAGTVVNPVVFVNNGTGGGGGGVAAAQTAAATPATTTTGQVEGVSTTTPNSSTGKVNASGSSTSKKNNGKVLGIETSNSSNKNGWYYGIGAVALVLLAVYYWFFSHNGKSPFNKNN